MFLDIEIIYNFKPDSSLVMDRRDLLVPFVMSDVGSPALTLTKLYICIHLELTLTSLTSAAVTKSFRTRVLILS